MGVYPTFRGCPGHRVSLEKQKAFGNRCCRDMQLGRMGRRPHPQPQPPPAVQDQAGWQSSQLALPPSSGPPAQQHHQLPCPRAVRGQVPAELGRALFPLPWLCLGVQKPDLPEPPYLCQLLHPPWARMVSAVPGVSPLIFLEGLNGKLK